MLDLQSLTLSAEEKEILQHPQVGGIILFTRNYQTPAQLKDLIHEIRDLNIQRLIAVDQEGGRVQRFHEGFTRLPALGVIGSHYEQAPTKAQNLAQNHAWLMATELLAHGIDFSFSPVLDLNKNISKVIGDRSFHRDPEIVVNLAKAYLNGMREAGMATIGKHFPGHGSVAADSHTESPVDHRDYEAIAKEDLIPFAHCVDDLMGIMPAHVIYSAVDEKPAGFSSFWLQTVLRNRLGFNGAIFSDDLSMAGASCGGDVSDRAKLALEVGCDMILVCNDRTNAVNVIESLEQQTYRPHVQSTQRLEKMFNQSTLQSDQLHKMPRWQQAYALVQDLSM